MPGEAFGQQVVARAVVGHSKALQVQDEPSPKTTAEDYLMAHKVTQWAK